MGRAWGGPFGLMGAYVDLVANRDNSVPVHMIYAADEGNYVSYVIDTMHSGSVAGDDRPRRTQSAAHPQHGGHGAADARRVVQLLLGQPLVDRAARVARLAVRVVPPARSRQARSGAMGAGAGGDRAAAVGAQAGRGRR